MSLLTDLTEKTTKPALNDLVHNIDISDNTQNAAGSSFKMQVINFLKGATFVPILGALVWKTGVNENETRWENGDWVIHMSESENRLVIGIALADITNVNQIDTSSEFKKFHESNPLL